MWEFGIIARNLYNGIGYSSPALTTIVPSAYMPPGLPLIYYIFFLVFGDNISAYIGILILNSLIMSFSVIISYLIAENIYNKQIAFLTAIYVTFSPVYLYSTISYNSIVFYFLFIGICFYSFIKIQSYFCEEKLKKTTNLKKSLLYFIILLSLTLGIFSYFRAEIVLLTLILTAYFLFKNTKLAALILISICVVILTPWTVRNYMVFGKIIPVSTSAGYNFYLGHSNDNVDQIFNEKLSKLKEDKMFEINKSNLGFELAFKYIKNNPTTELKESFSKIISFWITDKYRDLSKNPLYLLTWIVTLFFFIVGYYFSIKNKQIKEKLLFVNLMIILSSALVILFFNIPRYQIQISFLLIPTAMFGLYKTFIKTY